MGGGDEIGCDRLAQDHHPLEGLGLLGGAGGVQPIHVGGQHEGGGGPVLAGVVPGGLQVGFQLAVDLAQQGIKVALGVE